MGTGIYSEKLSYLNWIEFNKAVRVHQSSVENISSAITLILIGGLYFPIISASCGLA